MGRRPRDELSAEREAFGRPVAENGTWQNPKKRTTPKIALSTSRDIPLNKLLLSACNVRRVKVGVSIEQLADDIARRTLLQSLTVRPVLDADGQETGMYEIPAGGRRYRALELLVKQKRLAKTAPIPCVIRTDGIAEEDSLAENVQRAPLHPLDQFRAFLALREKGQSEEEIAAVFFVTVAVVKQRLRLASVSPKLLEVYAEDGMTLDQLMAFTVSGDRERQEQVWERLQSSYTREPYVIRRQLTEGAVRASDKRARSSARPTSRRAAPCCATCSRAMTAAGCSTALVDRLVAERLEREAEAVRAEGWKWIEVAPDFPYGHSFGLRQLRGETVHSTPRRKPPARRCRPSMTGSRRSTRGPRSCRRRWTSVWRRSRRCSPPSTSVRRVRPGRGRTGRCVRQHRQRGAAPGGTWLRAAQGRAARRAGA